MPARQGGILSPAVLDYGVYFLHLCLLTLAVHFFPPCPSALSAPAADLHNNGNDMDEVQLCSLRVIFKVTN